MDHNLRILFMGTPDFAVESLKCLVEAGKNIVGVITSPDRKSGRGQKINESAVKKYALEQNLTILQPTNLKDETFLAELKALKAELQIVVAFRMLPESVWSMPSKGTFNLHASLLPKYRGAAPINWAIINGEKESGITTFFLRHAIDTGDIIFQESVTIGKNETAGSLHDKLMLIGGKLVLKTVEAIELGGYKTKSQSELIVQSEKNYEAPKIFREDCKINWKNSIEGIDNFIRGLSPYPASWSTLQHKSSNKKLNVKIFEVSILNEEKNKQLSIESNAGKIIVHALEGNIEIIRLQVEGKKNMSASNLLNGFNLDDYELV